MSSGVRETSAAGSARKARSHVLRFVALNLLGGTAVLASYAWGVATPGVGDALWGGVPDSLRPLYTANMLAAAAGYFVFTGVVLQRRLEGGHDGAEFIRIDVAYASILFASALWLPLTAWMLEAPSSLLWAFVRIDLGLVALGTLGLMFELVLPRPGVAHRGRPERLLAALGLLPFALQTVVLDALIWPYYFGAVTAQGGSIS